MYLGHYGMRVAPPALMLGLGFGEGRCTPVQVIVVGPFHLKVDHWESGVWDLLGTR